MAAGAADVAAAGAAETPAPPAPGRCRRVPASSGRLGSRPLAAARRESDTPLRAAMALRLSPQRTVRPPAEDGAVAVPVDPVVPVAVVPVPVAGAEDAAPAAGIVRLVPATTRASGERPFAAATAFAESPLFCAMPHSVSPGATTCVAAGAAAAGRSAKVTRAAPSRRAVRSDMPHG
jgi:hypothetical protein